MAKHAKPSQKARRNGKVAIAVIEVAILYALAYALQSMEWVFPVDPASPAFVATVARDAQVVLTVAIGAAAAALVPWAVWHDFPTTQDASDLYDATHDDALIAPVLKLGDDIATIIRDKGAERNPATTIYEDIEQIRRAGRADAELVSSAKAAEQARIERDDHGA